MTDVFSDRRRRVLEAIGTGVLVLFAAPTALRNNDVEHEYRQDSDFFYLTGFDEPDSLLVLDGASDKPFILFVPPRDHERETWDGPRAGVEGAQLKFGADQAYSNQELEQRLAGLLAGHERAYYTVGRVATDDGRFFAALAELRRGARRGGHWPTTLIEPGTVLHELRLFKRPEEILALRRAVELTELGHRAAMRATRPGVYENQLEGILRHEFRAGGSERCAYTPIVASGANAAVLHHRRNQRRIQENELVLIDAGAEFDYYAGDVTRTFPASGRFSPLQRQVYECVLTAQLDAIDATCPGATLDDVHAVATRRLIEGLLELQLLTGSVESQLTSGEFRRFYMHRTSHWLGMDVHDVGRYTRDGSARLLEPGMVLTVEPGLYFGADDPLVPSELRGLGIRIEDDVLVTESGADNLSAAIPKTVDEIESWMAG